MADGLCKEDNGLEGVFSYKVTEGKEEIGWDRVRKIVAITQVRILCEQASVSFDGDCGIGLIEVIWLAGGEIDVRWIPGPNVTAQL